MSRESTDQLEWTPPIETGLSGSAYPNVQVGQFADDLDEAHQPGVYVIRLSVPTQLDLSGHKELWNETHGYTPDYVQQVAESEGVMYVGAAEDVLSRVQDHIDDSVNNSSTLMHTYPPHSVIQVYFYDSIDDAFNNEYNKEVQLRQTRSSIYIHSR